MPDMRFSPPPPVRRSSEVSGMNQVVARSLNERLIISLLLQRDGMTRMELVQASGLSAQTISVIVRALEADKLIVKGNAVKGRVGPPSRPINLNDKGAYSIGLNIRKTGITAVVVNLLGQKVAYASVNLSDCSADNVQQNIKQVLDALKADCGKKSWDRLIGIGLTLPRSKAPIAISESQLDIEKLEKFITEYVGQDVHIQDEMTALVSAEAIFGAAREGTDYIQFFVDGDLHTRICLDGKIYSGEDHACDSPRSSAAPHETLEWLTQSVSSLVDRIEMISKFVSTSTVIISTPYSSEQTLELVSNVGKELRTLHKIRPSNLGPHALATGAAALPFQVRFVGQHV
ncbi:ROK family transcriptional regulator [Cognatishimia maritima]|uniref:Sugar kinase of the NBD/HSP70 family, may contain an N-terminal HTH domain n=1 Tax=Cognatishimia maritima TaxID=870908 RepID=A0A1M5VFM1_9RHOB|nr:ROK family transcriptional regulator [Cognatishimia maritima]SHH74036.1 hypothetical protein SAMN04488044_3151 [Cognatishimia maritima]